MNRKRVLPIIVTIFIMLIAVSYALFTQLFVIEGEVTALSDFDVLLTESTVITEYNSNNSTTQITNSGSKLIISTNLESPGAYAEVQSTITNQSIVDVTLSNLVILGDDDPDITVDIIPEPQIGSELLVSEGTTFVIKIMWDEASIVTTKTINFSIEFTYEQST